MYVSAQSLDFLDLAEKCLISDLETASAHLFISGWALAKKIEGTPTQYSVCQNCGSTLTELPKETCPICKESLSRYKALKPVY